jgi:GR25 family glycosyltransferase involved in LPS biosynthesis
MPTDNSARASKYPQGKVAAEQEIPAFVVNLDRSPERWTRFLADNSLPGIAIERLAAVDGKALERRQLIANGLITDSLIYSNNAVACALSHRQCWQKVIELGQPALICEDDVVLRHDFAEVHQSLSNAHADADIVYWSYSFGLHVAYEIPGIGIVTMVPDTVRFDQEARITEFKDSTVTTALYRPHRVWGTACYTISPRGAQKLLELVFPLRNGKATASYRNGSTLQPVTGLWVTTGFDCDLGLIHIQKLNARVAVPPMALHRSSDVSTIDANDGTRLHLFDDVSNPSVEDFIKAASDLESLDCFDVAELYYNRAIEIDGAAADLHYRKGNMLIKLRRYAEAIASFDRVIELEPNHALAFNNRGVVLIALERLDEALASLDKALSLDPGGNAAGNREYVVARMASVAGTAVGDKDERTSSPS